MRKLYMETYINVLAPQLEEHYVRSAKVIDSISREHILKKCRLTLDKIVCQIKYSKIKLFQNFKEYKLDKRGNRSAVVLKK